MSDRAKRTFDLVLAVPALVLSLPIQVVTALAVRISMGRPVFFRQQRPGLHGRPFEMIKFRTMLEPDAARGAASDADRITPIGSALRATSIDELPSLWNIVKGDMSIVGPRPLLMNYLDRYTSEQARRHEVRPGLTGLAQVSGRNAITWEEKFAYDIQYVESCTLIGDLRIIARTLEQVLRRKGINAAEETTMQEFTGTGT